ncbi:MAG: hypothetical protein ACKOWR_01730 [Micrococcales bacterium]
MNKDFTLIDKQSALDLQAYLNRAKRLDPEGLVRLRAFGNVLAAYVAPIFSGSFMDNGPTVLGLRTIELAQDAEVDVLVQIGSVLERLAKVLDSGAQVFTIEVPPVTMRAAWAGISAPRSGWSQTGTINETVLTQIARDGIAEVADTLPASVGGPIAARIRGEIWGRGIKEDVTIPTGAAFVAAGLGFMTENEEVGIFHADNWVRLSTDFGHVLSRAASTVI